jgi:lipid II:glycine glycyltransferase (peptidoglycan interpeptide bridge formation enzyme)
MRFIEYEKSKEENISFIETNERCNFQQTIEWVNVKTSWKHQLILTENTSGKIIGSLIVWIRKILILGNIMYSARGSVCDFNNMEVLNR